MTSTEREGRTGKQGTRGRRGGGALQLEWKQDEYIWC